jgi:hypothetical protein
MLKYAVVATHMKTEYKEYKLYFPEHFSENEFISQQITTPFDDLIVDFLNTLSKEIYNDKDIRSFPDVATFAFFCRKANIITLKNKYFDETSINVGRGVVFHIAPSNVPVNFAYSLISGLLAGNINIVRIPTKSFEQIQIIINALNRIKKSMQFLEVLKKILLVGYDKNSNCTAYFSSICDVRVIWGGDETILQVRKNILRPRSFDVTFSDRYSFCIINSDNYINENNKAKIALNFYNDTFLFDQNACSAPHLIVWLGNKENIKISQDLFWSELNCIVEEKYLSQGSVTVDKLTNFHLQAIAFENVKKTKFISNNIWRISLNDLPINIENYKCAGGYFSEYYAEKFEDINKIINTKYQTLAYYGFSKKEINDFILNFKPKGIDRIVPIGKTTDFSLIWDGYNLINTLSRKVDII